MGRRQGWRMRMLRAEAPAGAALLPAPLQDTNATATPSFAQCANLGQQVWTWSERVRGRAGDGR
eukprot:scaffold86674_cov66-Phaeocystis_antarctica.AAC.2